MRDPNRISNFCNILAEYWEKYIPDWRFTQFMSNFFGFIYGETKRDPFYMEDDEIIEYLQIYFKEN